MRHSHDASVDMIAPFVTVVFSAGAHGGGGHPANTRIFRIPQSLPSASRSAAVVVMVTKIQCTWTGSMGGSVRRQIAPARGLFSRRSRRLDGTRTTRVSDCDASRIAKRDVDLMATSTLTVCLKKIMLSCSEAEYGKCPSPWSSAKGGDLKCAANPPRNRVPRYCRRTTGATNCHGRRRIMEEPLSGPSAQSRPSAFAFNSRSSCPSCRASRSS